jgi:hypothetical protein
MRNSEVCLNECIKPYATVPDPSNDCSGSNHTTRLGTRELDGDGSGGKESHKYIGVPKIAFWSAIRRFEQALAADNRLAGRLKRISQML